MSDVTTTEPASLTQSGLLGMSRRRRAALYASSPAGEIPHGTGRGVALILPGSFLARPLAWYVRVVGWKGKAFDRVNGRLRNLITPFGVRAIPAAVYPGKSLFDGGPSIVLDYSRTSWIARWVRDEIREIAPGLFLGYAYVLGRRAIAFSLDFGPAPD